MTLDYRRQVTFTGMILGAIVGAIGAMVWLDYLSGRELPATKQTTVGFGDMARVVTATLAIVRQINELAAEKDEPT